jgi:hypothetical protein
LKKLKGGIVIIKYSKNSIIYVACPAKLYTGGPELLHQLVYKLNKFGYNAKMFYYGKYVGDPVHEGYKMYNNEHEGNILDKKENMLIVPEIASNRHGI